jgi:hypothetical protein
MLSAFLRRRSLRERWGATVSPANALQADARHGRPENPRDNRKSRDRSSSTYSEHSTPQRARRTKPPGTSKQQRPLVMVAHRSHGRPENPRGNRKSPDRPSSTYSSACSSMPNGLHRFDRRAGCVAHKSGSVRGAPGQPGASTRLAPGMALKQEVKVLRGRSTENLNPRQG